MRILFVMPYSVVPPNSGNKNLTYGLLKYVTRHAVCDLVLVADFADDELKAQEEAVRREFPEVRNVLIFRKPLGRARVGARLRSIARGLHPALGSFHSAELVAWLRRNVSPASYDIVHHDMIHTTVYRRWTRSVPGVLVASDAYSLASRVARAYELRQTERVRLTVESALFAQVERRLYRDFDAVCTVSSTDHAHLRAADPRMAVRHIGIALFGPFMERKPLHLETPSGSIPRLLVTGSLDHSIIAGHIRTFIESSLPKLAQACPELHAVVLGRSPLPFLRAAIEQSPHAEHVEFVDDYAGFLDQDWIYVYPQRCGTGLQTKLQQAMAMGLPTVGFRISFGGFDEVDASTAFPCDSLEQIEDAVRTLVASEALRIEVGRAASAYVRERFSTDQMGRQMFDIYHSVRPRTHTPLPSQMRSTT